MGFCFRDMKASSVLTAAIFSVVGTSGAILESVSIAEKSDIGAYSMFIGESEDFPSFFIDENSIVMN